MHPDELDRLLSEEEIITPSAGFADAVMSEIGREADTPPRIGFPWKYVVAGLVSAGLGAAAAVSAGLAGPAPAPAAQWTQFVDWTERSATGLIAAGASPAAAALALAAVVMLVPMAVYEVMLRLQLHSLQEPAP